MAVSESQQKAQQVRDNYRKLRAQRAQAQAGEARATLKPPVLTAVIADPTDGTLRGPLLKDGLTVGIEWWENVPEIEGDENTMTLYWAMGHNADDSQLDYEEADTQTYIFPDFPALPRAMTVNASKLALDGPYTLKYSVQLHNGDQQWSAPVPLICDQTAPRGHTQTEPDAMTFPDIVITDANVATVVGTIPSYVIYSPGDTVIYGWVRELPGTPEELPYDGPTAVPSTPHTVSFDADHIRTIGDGYCFVSYALLDKATNRSSFAAYSRVHVALGPLPTNLHLPVVELADDGLDLDDAIAGIYVDIKLFDNWKPRDEVEITYGATVLDTYEVGPSPGEFLSRQVPSLVLKSEYGAATGIKKTNVSYRVLRGGAPFGGVQAITVDVDFSTIGPPRPQPDIDWPNPVNSDLDVGTVTSDSGAVNELPRLDELKDATFTFKLYDPVNEGETIKFYWNGVHMPEADLIVDEEVANEEISVAVLWKYIEAAGNKTNMPMYYRIGAPGSRNEQQSPDRLVNANAVVLRPKAAEFRDVVLVGGAKVPWLNCTSLDGVDHAIVVTLPDLSEWLGPGDTVSMKWWALPGRTGEPAPITDTELLEDITLTDAAGAFPVTGFEWRVQPYVKHVMPTYVDETNKDGRGRVT